MFARSRLRLSQPLAWSLALLTVVLLLNTALAGPVPHAAVKLWRLDCGSFVTKGLVNSCYLIRHGSQLMLWDTGFGSELGPKAAGIRVGASLVSQLARIGLDPGQISIVGLSHSHWDHIGQAASFPTATLLIGKEDWDALAAASPPESNLLAPWVTGHAPKSPVAGDMDIFGDDSVVMLATPGHTPGHHSLLVRLAGRGAVLLTGDLYYSAKQYEDKLVPIHNQDSERTAASFKRFDALARRLNATVVIQHEPQDVEKLPQFPEFAD
jgi:N-acyl homoserine lactone hydrolase